MAGEDSIHTIADKKRFQRFAQGDAGPVFLAGGINRMMKYRQLPARRGTLQLLFQPADLSCVEIGRIEHEKIQQSVTMLQRVVVSSTHVEQRILTLILPSFPHVVIA